MSDLPYANAQSGERALNDIQKLLRRFGCNKFGHMVDDDAGELLVQFEWQGRKVHVRASYRGYAAAWLRDNPWSTRRRTDKIEWERRALEKGSVAVYSIVRDWIKGQVMAVETGILTFEGAFLGQLLLQNGRTVLEHTEAAGLLEGPK